MLGLGVHVSFHPRIFSAVLVLSASNLSQMFLSDVTCKARIFSHTSTASLIIPQPWHHPHLHQQVVPHISIGFASIHTFAQFNTFAWNPSRPMDNLNIRRWIFGQSHIKCKINTNARPLPRLSFQSANFYEVWGERSTTRLARWMGIQKLQLREIIRVFFQHLKKNVYIEAPC